MTELAQIRLIAIAVVVGIVTAWVLARRSARQRQERFATLARIIIEEGKLTHRSRFLLRRLNGPRLHELLSRQAALAAQLERSL